MRRRVRKFQGGGMDASKSDFKTPSTTAKAPPSQGFGNPPSKGGGGGGNNNQNVSNIKKKKVSKFSTTNEPTDTPYKSNMLLNLAAGVVIPGGGILMEGAQRRAYKKRQEFARDQGLYRDFYRTEGKIFQPNNPANRKYMKEAGYGTIHGSTRVSSISPNTT